MNIEIRKLDGEFSICKIDNVEQVDFSREFVFLSKTDDEISLVCESDYIPSYVISSETAWRGLKIFGKLNFDMIGVIAKITNILAKAEISVFVVSTYDTDYFFISDENFNAGVRTLADNGYVIS